MINILMSGCNGRMGQTITRLCLDDPNLQIIVGLDREPDRFKNAYPVYRSLKEIKETPDVIIDFSSPNTLGCLIEYCTGRKIPLVTGTTGYSEADLASLQLASGQTAVFFSANMSLGIRILADLAVSAAAALYGAFDIEIFEKHHREKKDAPSGTALMIAQEINAKLGNCLEFVYDRSQIDGKRQPNELGISVLRGGTIPGEHSIFFAGHDEIIEIKHTSLSREVFAKGAMRAAAYMASKDKGFYDMKIMMKELMG